MEKKTIAPDKLYGYIREGIRKEVFHDRVELHVPFYFGGENDAPLCLTWYEDATLSDGGRTLTELKKRVGDITPYMDSIHKILANWGIGDVKLVGGQVLKLIYRQDPLRALNMLLQAIALISAVDRITVID